MNTKLLSISLSAVLVIGCTLTEPAEYPAIKQQTITISAYRADEPETKTQRNEADGSVLWTPGDAISIFYGSGTNGGSRFVSNAEEVSRLTNFTGTIGVITGGADVSVENTYFWGLYPYDAGAECDGSSIVTTLPSEQEAVPSTFATGLFPSIGHSQGLSMGFYNVCGGVRFTVTKEGLKSVTLKAIGGESLTGKARIAFEGGVPVVQEILEGSDEIKLTAPSGKYLEVGKFYYFVTFPQALSEGIELKFESFLEEGTYERRTSSLTIKRSTFGTLRNVDQNVEYSAKTGSIPVEDPAFKAYLTANYDSNSDGEISFEEAAGITYIGISPTNEYNLQSLKGIEYMPNLETIDCGGEWYETGDKSPIVGRTYYYVGPYKNNWEYAWGPLGTLRYIDVSANPKLHTLIACCNSALGEELGTIDVSHNTDLKHLDLGFTWLNYPDISNNEQLEFVQLTHLRGALPDLSKLSKVKALFIEHPQDPPIDYVDLDVSHMPDLEVLYIADRVKSLSDLSANPKLRDLYIGFCWQFSQTLDVSGNPELEKLHCTQCNQSSLDLSHNPKLKYLECGYNVLQSLDLSYNNLLEELNCECNNITELDLSSKPIKKLNCRDNRISSLILPDSMVELRCWNNPLGSLNVSGMEDLELLEFANTGVTSIDITHNPKLWKLSLNDNALGSIDLSSNPLLEELACWNCGLTELDLSHNPKLTWLRCWDNLITVLDVSNNPLLGTRVVDSSYSHDNGLCCSPMNDNQGNNVLSLLFVAPGQHIPYVTENRSEQHIPAGTLINSVVPIEDPVFKNYLLSRFDYDGDGELSYGEAKTVREIVMLPSNDYNLQSLKGIEYMPNLEVIDCWGDWVDYSLDKYNQPYYYAGPYKTAESLGPVGTLRYIDVSHNPKLVKLNVCNNSALGVELGCIDISHNPLLEELWLGYTWLEYPDISGNPHLKRINFSNLHGNLSSFAGFAELRELNIEWPTDNQNWQSNDIDVSGSPLLESLTISNAARSLSDLSNNPELKTLHWTSCPTVGPIDLTKLPKLEILGASNCGLNSLDISVLPELRVLYSDENNLYSIDFSNNSKIEELHLNGNNLSSLDLSGLPSLKQIYCDKNPISVLDVSQNPNLIALGFSGTQISSIDVSNNLELVTIGCDNIPDLTHLDLSRNTKLGALFIRGDGFTSIDIKNNAQLRTFLCDQNRISTLDVSNNLLLEALSCVQMNDSNGVNYLQTLYISSGQMIPFVTENRSNQYIPDETVISIAPPAGGGEETGDEEW